MYPKDTSEDPGPAHSVDGGGLQTEGMRRSLFNTSPTTTPPPPPSEISTNRVNITVAPFTGGPFEVRVSKMDSVDELKKVIARRLKVSKERIYLLYRESELVEGSVSTNLLVDGSTVTLLPRAETGLISPKPEQSVMQALESLNEQQVNDFLSGAAPLNLTMRLGDHMMLIQLQLSTVNQISSSRRKSTIQISSSSPPYPTPPPSAPASPTDQSTSSISSTQLPKKVRVPLLSPGGLYGGSSGPSASPSVPSTPLTASRPQTLTPPVNPTPQADAFCRPVRDGETGEPPAKKPKLDTKALAEASKNLTQTLKQLSSEVLTTKPEASTPKPKKEERQRKRRATDSKGAIIESMHHHGKGVYSGTFSGTLNPALQDANGQPKRDITTIVHILNDLLCAQYKAYSNSSSSRSSKHGHHRDSAKSSAATDIKTSPFGNLRPMHTSHPDKPIISDSEPNASERQLHEEQLNVTRHKVEALRKIMEERKAKRQARRQAAARAASYSTAWSVKSEAKPRDCDKREDGEHFLQPEPEPVTA